MRTNENLYFIVYIILYILYYILYMYIIQIHKSTILFTGLASSSFRNVDLSESASSVRSASISSQNKQSDAETKNKRGPKVRGARVPQNGCFFLENVRREGEGSFPIQKISLRIFVFKSIYFCHVF